MSRSAPDRSNRSPADRRFVVALAGISVAGLLLRIVVSWIRPAPGFLTDANFYRIQGELIAAGHGFASPFTFLRTGHVIPTAFHPPLASVIAAFPPWLGLHGIHTERVVTSLIGAVTIVAIGLAGRAIGGRRAGLLAAGIAALSPNLWAPDTNLNSEGIAACLVALVLLASYRLASRPRVRTAIALGLALGLAALVRPETLALAPFVLVTPLRRATADRRVRLTRAAVALCVAAIVVAPWVVRGMTSFEHPVPLTTNGVAVVGFANCPSTYHGNRLGSWDVRCPDQNRRRDPRARPDRGDESVIARAQADRGIRYLREHLDRLGVVVAARVGRTWSLYDPLDLPVARGDEGKLRFELYLGVAMLWVSLPLVVIGAADIRRRRRQPLLPLLGPLLVVTVTSVIAYGTPRFRVIAEPSIAILAAVGAMALWDRLRARATVVA